MYGPCSVVVSCFLFWIHKFSLLTCRLVEWFCRVWSKSLATSHGNCNVMFYMTSLLTDRAQFWLFNPVLWLRRGIKKLLSQPEGRSERGIGYSFQLAITTARKILIAYGTATAQSWLLFIWCLSWFERNPRAFSVLIHVNFHSIRFTAYHQDNI